MTKTTKLSRDKATQAEREAYALKRLLEGVEHDVIRSECIAKWGFGIGSSYLTAMSKKHKLGRYATKAKKQLDLPFHAKPVQSSRMDPDNMFRPDTPEYAAAVAKQGMQYEYYLPDGGHVVVRKPA